MANSNPANRLFTADTYVMSLYTGTVDFATISGENPPPALMDLLAIFRSARISMEVSEDDGSATWDGGFYPLPYRQRWTAEAETVIDLTISIYAFSLYDLFVSNPNGIGPYWLAFQKRIAAPPLYQRGTVKSFVETYSGDGPQIQSVVFSLWGMPQIPPPSI